MKLCFGLSASSRSDTTFFNTLGDYIFVFLEGTWKTFLVYFEGTLYLGKYLLEKWRNIMPSP